MIQLRTVNKKIATLRPGYELVKGEGYFWVYGPDSEKWEESMIYVYALNHQTLDQWIDQITDLIDKQNAKWKRYEQR